MKKKNTYENTELTMGEGSKNISGLHNMCIRTNQYVWDMMKILDKEEMFGFHFEAKVGEKKILVTLHHEDKEALKKAQRLLMNFEKSPDILFLIKVKEKKKMDKRWFIFYFLVLFLFILTFMLSFLYQEGYLDSLMESAKVKEKSYEANKELIVEEIVIDIEKLKLLKESFDEQNSTSLSPKVMKALAITTGIISETISEEEKAKYSSETLVKSFKGKSGFKLVLKKSAQSPEFNNTVEELNAYAMHFVKENNLSEALKYYDKVLEEDNVSKQEEMIASFHQAEIFETMGLNEEAKEFYTKTLKLTRELKENNETIHALNELVSLGHLAKIHNDLNETKEAKEIVEEAEKLYDLLILELKKYGDVKANELALALNYLANFYSNNKQHLLSIAIRQEALTIYEKLLKKEHKKFAVTYYKSLNALANSYLTINKLKLARQNYEKALHLMEKLIDSKIVKNRAYIALSFRALAMLEMKHHQLKEAKTYYEKALKIYQNLVKKEKPYEMQITEMYGEFAGLYALEKKFKQAGEAYQKAIVEYMRLSKKTPLKYNLQIAKLLNSAAFMKISNYEMNSRELIQAKMELREAISWGEKILEVNFNKAKENISESYAYLAYVAGKKKDMVLALEYYKMSYALKTYKRVKIFSLLKLNFHQVLSPNNSASIVLTNKP